MLTPDYQEFANRAGVQLRDNNVISSFGTARKCRNRRSVAGLPRCQKGTKTELSPGAATAGAHGGLVRQR